MREFLSSDDVCNQMLMGRALFKGTYVVVEGVTDQRLYEKFTDRSAVQVVQAHSKDNVRSSVRRMNERHGDPATIGIVDRDLDGLTGRKESPPLFSTDKRDMEMMLIYSNALDDVLDEYADGQKLKNFLARGKDVRQALVDASYPLGLLMYISKKNRMSLNFRDLDFTVFVDQRTLVVSIPAMINAVVANTANVRIGRGELSRMLTDQTVRLKDKWLAARGHDAVDILLIGLRKTFGSYNARNLTEGELGGALRLAYSDSDFRETNLYRSTRKWAEANGVRLWKLRRP
ncbi:MAG: DUF4435 domain-containing protein [Candidatus Methanomethylophilaceae archaeon]|nr:DUF4435 domain-containing protein [Candidatus Methanomethylophilaceae archaeon]